MLDRHLCKILGVDEFKQYIMKELDRAEDQLNDPNLSAARYIDIKSRYDAFKQVRDAYCKFTTKKN